ncbi:MAG: type II toxin-antitoxin system RelE/ParE family toxin [Pirellulaceae bacterium]
MAKATRSAQAQDDIDDLADYIAEENPTAARQFLDAVERTIQLLTATPELGGVFPLPGRPQLRAHRISPRFRNYIVFYESNDDGVLIVRVIHGRRDLTTAFESDC